MFREHRHAAVRDGLDEGYHGRGAVAGLREGLTLEDLDGGARVEDVCVDEGDDVGGEERCQELLHDRFVHGLCCWCCCDDGFVVVVIMWVELVS